MAKTVTVTCEQVGENDDPTGCNPTVTCNSALDGVAPAQHDG